MIDLKLERPLAVFDIESTGTNRKFDRIIDLAIVKLLPDGTSESHTFRVNPGMPIPAESTAIHGITNEDVKDSPTFKQIAANVAETLQDCDLAGYNISNFDIPLLWLQIFYHVAQLFNAAQSSRITPGVLQRGGE